MKALLSTGPNPSSFVLNYFLDKVAELVGVGSVVSGAYPV